MNKNDVIDAVAERTGLAKSDAARAVEAVLVTLTEALQKAFFDVVECRVADEFRWLTFVREAATAAASQAPRKKAV